MTFNEIDSIYVICYDFIHAIVRIKRQYNNRRKNIIFKYYYQSRGTHKIYFVTIVEILNVFVMFADKRDAWIAEASSVYVSRCTLFD